ncbi:MAG: carboxymuconolactone decarboxylase family protein [Steroidobacteraceae bacterium]|nr:carboxymuconolactone decarboxylase family protein [Steroidobacteraceae bacterium]
MPTQPDTPLARLSREQLPEHMRDAWDQALQLHGDATFVEVFGHAPHVYDWYLEEYYRKLFYSGRIERSVVELVRLRLANVHGCAFCNRSDTLAALAGGVPQAKIDALADYEAGPFTDREKAALALADVMVLTNTRGHITPDLYKRLRAYYSDGELVELGVIMAVLCGMAKMVFAFDLVEKMDSCPYLPPGGR